MLRLTDRSTLTELPSPPGGIELPPLREPESLEMTPFYVSSAGATVMSSVVESVVKSDGEIRFCRNCAQKTAFRIDPRGSWYQCSRCGHYE
jgi:hypothetical protein